ncbi:protein spartin isoform X1 [Musca domestica]|uniref:Protein spartin isoform X1 n=2 Tax=Musca domestica TaxID=7370 RepID=A0A1I8N797_MUSDO|nr:protein spartin isoform X1 [Musca domestica]
MMGDKKWIDMDVDINKIIAMTTDAEFLSSYEQIKEANKFALKQVECAIGLEELGKPLDAIRAYEEALKLIEKSFAIPVSLPDNTDNVEKEWNDACLLIQKLKAARTEVTYRLKILKQQHAPIDTDAVEASELPQSDEPQAKKKSNLLENPQTYYDITNNGGGPAKTYKQITKGLRDIMADRSSPVLYDTLFQAKVKLYKIMPNGEVRMLAGETSMSLVMCTIGGEWSYLNGLYFIQCAIKDPNIPSPMEEDGAASSSVLPLSNCNDMIWIYPLVSTVTTCYHTEYGAFILPDLESNEMGSAFGLILCPPPELSEEAFADLQQFFLDLLEAVLAGTVEQIPETAFGRPPRDTSQQVSKNIVTTADFIARGLIKGAEKTGELMRKSTPYIISKLKPAPENPPPISPAVHNTVAVAKGVTSAAVGVTGWVANKVGSASVAIGKYLAPHIQHHGASVLQKTCGLNENDANKKMTDALTVAAGAVEGFSTIVDGLEKSAAILGNNISENSVKIIDHKYGRPASSVAAETFDTLGNAFVVSRNVNYMLPKGIAKKLVKHSGKAVIEEYKYKHESQYITAGALYPDLRVLKETTTANVSSTSAN